MNMTRFDTITSISRTYFFDFEMERMSFVHLQHGIIWRNITRDITLLNCLERLRLVDQLHIAEHGIALPQNGFSDIYPTKYST